MADRMTRPTIRRYWSRSIGAGQLVDGGRLDAVGRPLAVADMIVFFFRFGVMCGEGRAVLGIVRDARRGLVLHEAAPGPDPGRA